MAIERGHLSIFTKWMLWSDTPVRGRKSTLPNPYFYFVFVSSFFPPKHTHHYRPEWKDLNWCLVGFGQQHCLPIGPKCSSCLNKDICPASSTRVTKEEKQEDKELENLEENNS